LTTRFKGLLCILFLLLLFGCVSLSSNGNVQNDGVHPVVSASLQLPSSPTLTTVTSIAGSQYLSAPPFTHSIHSENTPYLIETAPIAETQLPSFSSHASLHTPILEVDGTHLFRLNQNEVYSINASLLILIANTLGLSSLVMRE
jgi:hypothetical protein